jgi:hypothetical protein
LLRRVLVLAVLLYLTADYCDPLVPGVFWFGADSFFVESTEARPAMPELTDPTMRAVLPTRVVVEPIMPRALASAPPRARIDRYALRSFVAVSPASAPESSEDH